MTQHEFASFAFSHCLLFACCFLVGFIALRLPNNTRRSASRSPSPHRSPALDAAAEEIEAALGEDTNDTNTNINTNTNTNVDRVQDQRPIVPPFMLKHSQLTLSQLTWLAGECYFGDLPTTTSDEREKLAEDILKFTACSDLARAFKQVPCWLVNTCKIKASDLSSPLLTFVPSEAKGSTRKMRALLFPFLSPFTFKLIRVSPHVISSAHFICQVPSTCVFLIT